MLLEFPTKVQLPCEKDRARSFDGSSGRRCGQKFGAGFLRTAADPPSASPSPRERCSSSCGCMKVLQQLIGQLSVEVDAAKSSHKQMQEQQDNMLSRQKEVLSRLERFHAAHCDSTPQKPFPKPFPKQEVRESDIEYDMTHTAAETLAETSADYDDIDNRESDKQYRAEAMQKARADMVETVRLKDKNSSTRFQSFKRIMKSSAVGFFNSSLTTLNMVYFGIVAGVDLELVVKGTDKVWLVEVKKTLDLFRAVFLVLFLFELICNILVENRKLFRCRNRWWHLFDAVVVIVDVVEYMLTTFASQIPDLRSIATLRIIKGLKVLRLVRMVRALKYARDVRLLLLAIISSVKHLLWAMCLLCCIIYMFSVAMATAISSNFVAMDLEILDTDLRKWWGSLSRTSLTLFQSISGGVSWTEPFDALESQGNAIKTMFIIYLSFCIFAVLNVVTAVFCNSAIETATKDNDMLVGAHLEAEANYVKDLKDLFHRFDEDHSGKLTIYELESRMGDHWISAYMKHLRIECRSAWEFFRLLDKDHNKDIDMDEFVAGCMRLRGDASCLDMHNLMHKQAQMLRSIEKSVYAVLQMVPTEQNRIREHVSGSSTCTPK